MDNVSPWGFILVTLIAFMCSSFYFLIELLKLLSLNWSLNAMNRNHLFCIQACSFLLFIEMNSLQLESKTASSLKKGDELWQYQEELAEEQLEGIHRYLDRREDEIISQRSSRWSRNLKSPEAYQESVKSNLERLRHGIGLIDERSPVTLEYIDLHHSPEVIKRGANFEVYQGRWSVFGSIQGEGLILKPRKQTRGLVIAIPDADQTPEQLLGIAPGIPEESQFPRHIANSGWTVVVPALINREIRFSGGDHYLPQQPWRDTELKSRWTNIPHREWALRQSYIMGRHLIGYEVQKILALVDWFQDEEAQQSLPVGVAGYGEGGMLALFAAAVDSRIKSALVSGSFGPREEMWKEPVSRSIWGYLTEFGDAEVASLIAPRKLVIEYSQWPSVEVPPPAEPEMLDSGARGELRTPDYESVEKELDRLIGFFDGGDLSMDAVLVADEAKPVDFGSKMALEAFLAPLSGDGLSQAEPLPAVKPERLADPVQRQRRLLDGIIAQTREQVRHGDHERYAFIQGDVSSPEAWDHSMERYREFFWEEIIGKVPGPELPPNARLRQIIDAPDWTGYEVILDVFPEMFSFGMLGVPKDLKDRERRPAVVIQHGRHGIPLTPLVVNSYHRVFDLLTSRGFITYAPHNPYEKYGRRGIPLKLSRFSILLAQHQQILKWLTALPYVDGERIGFYGKSWGGKSALYLPALL